MPDSDLHPNAARVQAALVRAGAEGAVHQLAESTATSADAARALGVELAQIGKSLVFLTDDRAVVIVLSGADRLDAAALAAFLDVERVRRPDAQEVRSQTGYPIGGVSPIGLPPGVPVLIDDGLAAFDVIWVAAGTPNAVFPTTHAELVRITAARPGRFRV